MPRVHATAAEIETSLRRSRVRCRVLVMLSSLGEASPRQLALASGTDIQRVHWAMRGHAPQYRAELGLLALGLADARATPNGRVYVVTALGRKKARQLTARRRRKVLHALM